MNAIIRPPKWSDWRWQLRNMHRPGGEDLSDQESQFEVGVTPYFWDLVQRTGGVDGPLGRQVVPSELERSVAPFEHADPLGEDPHRVAPGLVRKYPDRVLLLVTDTCASYCRYCTRSRWVAGHTEPLGSDALAAAIDWIKAHPEIRDVLVSGGDPLLLSNRRLSKLLDQLNEIDHLRLIRIGSRVPVFAPMRVDEALCEALRPRKIPLFMNVHINHHAELTEASRQALRSLGAAGISLGGQTVLLRGVNDDIDSLRETMYRMLQCGVRPYYLFHCDPVRGSAHLRTSVDKGLELMKELVGHVSGMAVPKYCIDLKGAGKVPLWPDYVVDADEQSWTFRGYGGVVQRYPR
mgnify:CR=1 FL=1